MRISAAVGALLGWFAWLLQLYLILAQSPAGALAMVGTVITYFSFFTILTNILVALVFTATVFAREPDGGSFSAVRRCRPALRLTSLSWASSTVCCCGNYGIRRACSGSPT